MARHCHCLGQPTLNAVSKYEFVLDEGSGKREIFSCEVAGRPNRMVAAYRFRATNRRRM
jgi:hypothetical protein